MANKINVSLTTDELKEALECGIINKAYVQEQLDMKRKKELLQMHPYNIWQGKDGYWHTYLPVEGGGRKQVKRASEESVIEAVTQFWQEKNEDPTIRDLFQASHDEKLELKLISPDTRKRYQQDFDRYFGEFGERKVKDIREDDYILFLEQQIAKYHLTAKSFSNLKILLRCILFYAKRKQYIDFSISDMFDMVRTGGLRKVIKEDYEEVFTEDESRTLEAYLEANLDIQNAGLLLMLTSGIRVGELVALKCNDIMGPLIQIRRTEIRVPKEGGSNYVIKDFPKSKAGHRTVTVSEDYEWLCSLLKDYNSSSEYIFVDKDGKRMTTNCIRRRAQRVCKALNIYPKSPHKYRKTYISILLDNHVDNRMVMDLAGHEEIQTSERNYHRNRKKDAQRTAIISQIPEFRRRLECGI